jgi:AAA+ ATPase superfamily predicted ATPase
MQNAVPVLRWIQFGKVSAERDDLLSEYFFDNGVLNTVINSPPSFLILGRKGAGKTAVFKYLSENKNQFLSDSDILLPLSFDDYNWNVHSLLRNEGKAESMLYKQSWRFVILVESVKAISDWMSKKGRILPRSISSITKILEKLFGSPVPSLGEMIGKKILSLSKVKLPSTGIDLESGDFDKFELNAGEISFDEVQRSSSLREALAENIEHLIRYLDNALLNADDSWPTTYLCFDRVDEAWDRDSFESSRRLSAGWSQLARPSILNIKERSVQLFF